MSFSSGLARQRSFLFPFSHVCVPVLKPDGNKGKLLTEAGAKTFHLKRKLHLCALLSHSPLLRAGILQRIHLCSLWLMLTDGKGRASLGQGDCTLRQLSFWNMASKRLCTWQRPLAGKAGDLNPRRCTLVVVIVGAATRSSWCSLPLHCKLNSIRIPFVGRVVRGTRGCRQSLLPPAFF